MQKLFKFQFRSITHRLIFSCVASAIAIYSISYWHGRYLIQKNIRSFIIDLSQSNLIMTFQDGGKPFNPLTEVITPDRDDHERSLGGFGFFLVQELSERVDYNYRDGKNILTVSQLINVSSG